MTIHEYPRHTERVVKALFKAHAAKFTFGKQIRFKSGILSPGAYNNNRMVPSYPDEWDVVLDAMEAVVKPLRKEFDIIASVATGGISHGAALARMLRTPHIIIKKDEKKGHGLSGLIDGDVGLLPRARVLMVEDMSSTFESTLKAMQPVVAESAIVSHTIAISTWGFPQFRHNTEGHNVHVLCTGDDLIDEAYQMRLVGQSYYDILKQWVMEPDWQGWYDERWQ